MLTLALYALLAIAVMAAVFFVVAALLPAGEQIAPPVRDERPWELPADQALGADEVAAVRLPVALRGYRFAETDRLLDRLGDELRARDELIARLRGQAPAKPAKSADPGVPAKVPPGEVPPGEAAEVIEEAGGAAEDSADDGAHGG